MVLSIILISVLDLHLRGRGGGQIAARTTLGSKFLLHLLSLGRTSYYEYADRTLSVGKRDGEEEIGILLSSAEDKKREDANTSYHKCLSNWLKGLLFFFYHYHYYLKG